MSNDYTPSKVMGELFVDATKEIVERTRIKGQIARLQEIMAADKKRLRNAYAEIGRMYCEGTLEKNKARVEMLYDTIDHLKLREERAKIRLEQLRKAHSVDECTVAFREELESKVQQAKDKTAEVARDLSTKAKAAVDNLPDKAQETITTIKQKASVAADKAKAAVDEVASRATAAVSRIGSGEGSTEEEYPEGDEFRDMYDEFEYEDEYEDDNYIEEYSEEDQAAAADIGAILGSIDLTLKEVDEADPAPAEETAQEAPADTDSTDDSSSADGESPESFDF
ncbi:MAG: hypothetical protein IJ298_01555 [Ruminococcus sp.]|nr:hypothetical protein [Ruminococcus sp.]